MFGLGFVLSFGYWTTNFAEVQRALSAKDMNAAQRTPLIGAFPKLFIPLLVVIPGLVALVTVKGFGTGSADIQQYNNAIPALMAEYLPSGMLGLAITALIASFMAGVAANVSAFNTVVTYDLYQDYIRGDAGDRHYIWFGRIMTVVGILISIGTAFIAKGYDNIMNYVQLLFSYFNAPLFATFIIGLFWKRATRWGGIAGLVAGTLGAFLTHLLYSKGTISFGSPLSADFWGAIVAFGADAIVTVVVSLATQPRKVEELQGLVWGMAEIDPDEADRVRPWWQRPVVLAVTGKPVKSSMARTSSPAALERRRGAAGRDDLDAELGEALREVDDARLVRHGEHRAADAHLAWLGHRRRTIVTTRSARGAGWQGRSGPRRGRSAAPPRTAARARSGAARRGPRRPRSPPGGRARAGG